MKKIDSIKLIIILAVIVLYAAPSFGQGFKKTDKIQHDVSYYRESRVAKPLVKVLYGRPSAKEGEVVFGGKIPFNQLWRTGANEATEIKLYKDVLFGNKFVKAGTYTMYTIPNKNKWEIILSSNTDVLGAFQYDSIFDVARVTIPVQKAQKLDTFSIGFKKQNAHNISMILAWGITRVKVPLNFNIKATIASAKK